MLSALLNVSNKIQLKVKLSFLHTPLHYWQFQHCRQKKTKLPIFVQLFRYSYSLRRKNLIRPGPAKNVLRWSWLHSKCTVLALKKPIVTMKVTQITPSLSITCIWYFEECRSGFIIYYIQVDIMLVVIYDFQKQGSVTMCTNRSICVNEPFLRSRIMTSIGYDIRIYFTWAPLNINAITESGVFEWVKKLEKNYKQSYCRYKWLLLIPYLVVF